MRMILLAFIVASPFGCMDQPTRVDVVSPNGALIFDSPKDAIDIHVRVRAEDMTDVAHPKIVWTSSDRHIAAVSTTGRVTPGLDGRAVITARSGSVEASLPVVVHFYDRIETSPKTLTMSIGDRAFIHAALFDADGGHMFGTLTWTSLDPSIATVDAEGEVIAESSGTTVIEVSLKHLKARVLVHVAPMAAS